MARGHAELTWSKELDKDIFSGSLLIEIIRSQANNFSIDNRGCTKGDGEWENGKLHGRWSKESLGKQCQQHRRRALEVGEMTQ
jgi:hypothetical protein